jgi:hypothetical protein
MANKMFERTTDAFKPSGFFDEEEDVDEVLEEEDKE